MALFAGRGRLLGFVFLVVGLVAALAVVMQCLGMVFQPLFFGEFLDILSLGPLTGNLVTFDAFLNIVAGFKIFQGLAILVVVTFPAPVFVKIRKKRGYQ